jgi:Ca-activated chloride channel family protein
MNHLLSNILGTVLVGLWALSAAAQATPSAPALKDTVLILDASGSMWGQIDGVNKIVIAKDVVEELVRGLSPEQRLGLVAYGHRTEGDCNDIQTLADVGAARADVVKAIRGISPKGKTPLTRSVEHAANDLNYTKKAATVILVSDGLENCAGDPCALAKTLEENGLDFTVHVIGFDITVEERKSLQCIAEETGGEFLAADNASELTEAISQVVVAEHVPAEKVASTPVPSSLALKATILSSGPQIQSNLSWTVSPKVGGEVVFSKENTGATETELLPGDYVVDVVWTGWKDGTPKKGRMEFSIKPQQPRVITVPIDLELPVSLEAPAETAEGIAIPVTWSGPDDLNTTINVNLRDHDPLRKIYFFPAARARSQAENRADTDGDGDIDNDDTVTALLGAPTVPGEYEVRYVLNDPVVILARRPITVTDSHYELIVPESVPVSTEMEVSWSGPAEPAGVITLTEKDSPGALNNKMYVRAEAGKPAKLTTPPIAGDYEIRYVMSGGYTTFPGMERSVQAIAPIRVTDVSASVSGPETAVGGSTIEITWQGPAEDWQDDFISIVEPGAEKYNRDSTGKLVSRSGETLQPAPIRVPAIEGEYEVVYGLQPGGRIIARSPITITRATATIDAPDTMKLGDDIPVTYSGDGFEGDRVVITPADTPDIKMWGVGVNYGFAATADGTTGSIRGKMVQEAGVYEVRYVTGLQHQVLARDVIEIAE